MSFLAPRPACTGRLVAALLVASLFSACGGDGDGSPTGIQALSLEPTGSPSISSDGDGRTRVLMSFVARASLSDSRRAMTVAETKIEFYLDGAKVSGESVLDRNELGGDMMYSLVLDGSYSMIVDHQPPAFQPMLAAARASVEAVTAEWQARGSLAQVRADWLWFDDYIHYPDDKSVTNISLITAPRSGENDTRLFGAVDFMLQKHVAAVASGFATKAQDRHVMVLFTDGRDNRSYFVTQETNEQLAVPFPHLKHRPGQPTNTHQVLVDRIAALRAQGKLPTFTLHSIGLGTNLDAEPIRQLAESQGGVFVQNPSSGKLASLFETITREVVSIQTAGVKLPLRAGAYQLTVRVMVKDQPELFADHVIDFTAQ